MGDSVSSGQPVMPCLLCSWAQLVYKDNIPKLGVVALTLHLSPAAVQVDLCQLQASQGYIERPCLKR